MASAIPQMSQSTLAPTSAPGAPAIPNQTPSSASLYVGDLSPEVTEALLFEIFNPIGAVSSIRVCRDSTTRRSLGYAYVNFLNATDAERALDTLNFVTIKGRPCRIMWSHRDPSVRKNPHANIFIKNLDKTIDNKEFYDTFSQFGNILSCKVATDYSGASRGYGFVHYQEEADALKAITEVNDKILKGKKVTVCKFERRQDRPTTGSRFTNLYFKDVPEEWDEKRIRDIFDQFGQITSFALRADPKLRRGYGFVNYNTPEEAETAVEQGRLVSVGENKFLYVDRFQSRGERQARLERDFNEKVRDKTRNSNLFVKNLDDQLDSAKLKELFSVFGPITSCVIMTDGKTPPVSRGFGFVCFENPDDATKALNEMNSKIVGAKPIYVNRAQRKDERRQQLETQFQANVARMQTMQPVFYGAPHQHMNMGMGQPVMYPPQMMNRRMPAAQMRGTYPPQYGAPQPGGPQQPMQRPRNAPGVPRAAPSNPRGGPSGQQKFRQQQQPGNPQRYPREMIPAHPALPHGAAIGELTSHALVSASPEMQKQMLGERLFPMVQKEQPEQAGKITGMILEMEVSEILSLLDNPSDLHLKVAEAVEVLKSSGQA